MGRFSLRMRPDGTSLLASTLALDPYPPTVCSDLVKWAQLRPNDPFLAERWDGAWSAIGYATALERVRSIGAGLLRSPASVQSPLAIVAENGIDHALTALASMYVGVPVAPLSTGYAGPASDSQRLRDLLGVLGPGLIVTTDAAVATRVAAAAGDVPVLTGVEALAGEPSAADAAFANVGPETVAKIMFTSGSTGTPKGVITTNQMLAANQTQIAMVWPETAEAAPIFVDWLPWSHTFGGSFMFGLILRNGGTLYIDDGRPAPGAFAATIRNLREIAPTFFLSVPRVFTLLLEALHGDEEFTKVFFRRLRGLGNAGAALPNPVRDELIRLSRAYAPGEIRVTSSWGLTETAPMVTTSWGPVLADDDTIGMPAPGIEVKFVPSDGRTEICVRGPNVTPGYWRNPSATSEVFDAEGFYHTGDAARLKDLADPARGILFEGRLAENFKLATGTWVNVGALRLALIERGDPIVEDVVITGHDTESIGVLIFIRAAAAAQLVGEPGADHGELAGHAHVRAFVARVLTEHNAAAPASSTRVARALILPGPPDRAQGEITDKGSVNQRRALMLRAAHVARLAAAELHYDVVTPQPTAPASAVGANA